MSGPHPRWINLELLKVEPGYQSFKQNAPSTQAILMGTRGWEMVQVISPLFCFGHHGDTFLANEKEARISEVDVGVRWKRLLFLSIFQPTNCGCSSLVPGHPPACRRTWDTCTRTLRSPSHCFSPPASIPALPFLFSDPSALGSGFIICPRDTLIFSFSVGLIL